MINSRYTKIAIISLELSFWDIVGLREVGLFFTIRNKIRIFVLYKF